MLVRGAPSRRAAGRAPSRRGDRPAPAKRSWAALFTRALSRSGALARATEARLRARRSDRAAALRYTDVLADRDSRKHLRVQADPTSPVRVDIMGQGFLDVLNARDISIGGLGVCVPHDFAECDLEQEVDLIVSLGRGRPFKARGTIRHHSKAGAEHVYGVEFSSLSPEQREQIEAYVEACLRRRRSRSMARVSSMPARP